MRTPATAPGITVQMPDAFFRAAFDELPASGAYGIGVCFLPRDAARRAEIEQLVEKTIADEGQQLLGWRDVPVDEQHVGETARAYAPVFRQVVVGAAPGLDQDAFERKLYVIRRVAELAGGCRPRRPELLFAHARLQRHALGAATRRVLSRPRRPAVRRARSRWCTPATRRTRSRAGSSRTRTA